MGKKPIIAFLIRLPTLTLISGGKTMEKKSSREVKLVSAKLFQQLTGKRLRILVIQAGFAYHKSPHLFQWLWVFILLPFLEEDSLNELSENYGQQLRKLYPILIHYYQAFQKLLQLLAFPIFFEELAKFSQGNESYQSRHRPMIIVDDTKTEKSGKIMEFLHRLFDHVKDTYIMGYNPVVILAVFGDFVFPISIMLWLPKTHPDHRSKNDMACDFISQLKAESQKRGCSLDQVEITFDSAYCKQKVIKAAKNAGLTFVSKPSNNHTFEFEGMRLSPKEIIEKVKDRTWKYYEKDNDYQRFELTHPVYGQVVLIVRRRILKNGKVIYDVLICNKLVYNGVQINNRYRKRWQIELHIKYYKQYLNFGKGQFQKLGAIQSQLYCVALAGLVVALFRLRLPRKVSFRTAVKRIIKLIYHGQSPPFQPLAAN
jgi:hypothetical protein